MTVKMCCFYFLDTRSYTRLTLSDHHLMRFYIVLTKVWISGFFFPGRFLPLFVFLEFWRVTIFYFFLKKYLFFFFLLFSEFLPLFKKNPKRKKKRWSEWLFQTKTWRYLFSDIYFLSTVLRQKKGPKVF